MEKVLSRTYASNTFHLYPSDQSPFRISFYYYRKSVTKYERCSWPVVCPVFASTSPKIRYCMSTPTSLCIMVKSSFVSNRGWSGGAKVLGKLPVPGRPTILITVGQGSTVLAVDAGGGGLDIFTLIYPFSSLSPSLWETARYRLKYCLKGPLNPKQPTNQNLLAISLMLCFLSLNLF